MSKKVYLLWFGQTISWTGSAMSFFAIGVWIYETTGKASALSTILFIVAIVGVVTGPFGGVLADRFPRKTRKFCSPEGSYSFFALRGRYKN